MAKVVNIKTGLNLRSAPDRTMSNTLMLIPLGAVVDILAENCGDGFAKVRYDNVEGYCTRHYLLQLDGLYTARKTGNF